MSDELVIQLAVPRPVADRLPKSVPDGVDLEPARASSDPAARFGFAEVMTIIGLVKSVQEVIKLALEIRKLLRETKQASARLALANTPSYVEIDAASADDDLEQRVRDHLAGDGRPPV